MPPLGWRQRCQVAEERVRTLEGRLRTAQERIEELEQGKDATPVPIVAPGVTETPAVSTEHEDAVSGDLSLATMTDD